MGPSPFASHSAAAQPPPRQPWAYRFVVPALALGFFGILALLWALDLQPAYFAILNGLGVAAYRFPFLDIHAVLSAAECHRQGIDVYAMNPCDALGRLDGYSPLWLAITPSFLGTKETAGVGLGIVLLFILSLPFLLRPRSRGEILIFAAAVFSPMTLFALERANIDVIIFLLSMGAAALYVASHRCRLGSYALFLFAGLLKFYPLVLLVLMAREAWRNFRLPATLAVAAIALFVALNHADLSRGLANIPPVPYYTDGFSAGDLPYGLAARGAKNSLVSPAILALLLLGALAAMAAALAWRNIRRLAPIEKFGAGEWEGACLAIGALLLTACFFAAPNVDYRGILFLFVLPGLLHLRRAAATAAAVKFFSLMVAATLFLMWKEFFRHALFSTLDWLPNVRLREPFEAAFWLGRELLWWWLISGLAAIAFLYFRRLPLVQESLAGLSRLTGLSLKPF